MKQHLAVFALIILAVAAPIQLLAQDGKAEQEVRATLEEIKQANLKGGAEAASAFESLFAPEYTRITADGTVHNKAEMLNGFRTGKTKIEAIESLDVKIHIYGNTAVVTGLNNSKGTVVGAAIPEQTRWTRVLVKRGGTWESVAYQSTRVAPK